MLVFGDDGNWGPTRSVWNQMSYHYDNCDDNLDVSHRIYTPWLTNNLWRAQLKVACGYPQARIIMPRDSTWTACSDQRIIMHIADLNGINVSTIRLQVESTEYTIPSPYLTFTNDSILTFIPPINWADNETVNVCLLHVEDTYHNAMEHEPLCWLFFVDLTPPHLFDINPTPFGFIIPESTVSFYIVDNGSGLDTSSIRFTINEIPVHFSHTDSFYSYSLPSWPGEIPESLNICVRNMQDTPDYCTPNRSADTCFWYLTRLAPELQLQLLSDTLICLPSGRFEPNPITTRGIVLNTGRGVADSVSLLLSIPSCFSLLEGDNPQKLYNITPSSIDTAIWLLNVDVRCENRTECFHIEMRTFKR